MIRQFFNNLQAKREQKRLLNQRYENFIVALGISDADKVKAFSAYNDYTPDQKTRLLEAAVETDDVATFRTVLAGIANNNPNYLMWSGFTDAIDGPHHYTVTSLLFTAIASGCRAIALDLASDPKTDVNYVGHSYSSMYHSGGLFGSGHAESKTTKFESPLELAQKMYMDKVADVLVKREIARLASGNTALSAALQPILA